MHESRILAPKSKRKKKAGSRAAGETCEKECKCCIEGTCHDRIVCEEKYEYIGIIIYSVSGSIILLSLIAYILYRRKLSKKQKKIDQKKTKQVNQISPTIKIETKPIPQKNFLSTENDVIKLDN